MSIEKVTRKRKGTGYKVWYRDENGKGRSQTFDRKKDAEAFEAEIRLKKRRGHLGDLDAGREPLRALVEDWWERYAVPSHAPKTLEVNRWLLDKYVLPRLGEVPVARLRPTLIEDFSLALQRDGVGAEVRRKSLALLQTILNRAVVRGAIPTNPVALVKKPSQRRRRRIRVVLPSVVEAMRAWFLDQDRTRDALLLSVLAYAGLRPGEALALRRDSIGEATITVTDAISLGAERGDTKTFQDRTVRLIEPLRNDLAEWFTLLGPGEGSQLIFSGVDGRPWSDTTYRNWRKRFFRVAAEAAGSPELRPYDLRHSFASIHLALGERVLDTAAQLGHSPTMTLNRYGHLLPEIQTSSRGRTFEEMIEEARRLHTEPEPEILEPDTDETEHELHALHESYGGFNLNDAVRAARRGLSVEDALREADEIAKQRQPAVPVF